MATNPKIETAFGGCPHDCPDTCAMVFDIEVAKSLAFVETKIIL